LESYGSWLSFPISENGQQMNLGQMRIGIYDLSVFFRGPIAAPGGPWEGFLVAGFRMEENIERLFPYIHAEAERAVLSAKPPFIRFVLDRTLCILYPDRGLATPFEDRSAATRFVDRLVQFLKEILAKARAITPKYALTQRVSAIEVLKLLPKTNCRECGFPSCLAFAAMLSLQRTDPHRCPYMVPPIARQALYPVYDQEGNLVSTLAVGIDPASAPPGESVQQGIKGPPEGVENHGGDSRPEDSAMVQPLTARETEVLRLMAEGATNTEIAYLLDISPHTVKSHVIHIFNKLGVNDRTHAAVTAARLSLI
jgi:DNA-binding CsgD family transcriptional regulator/ArsR family metal-binding transcriptional regulator